MREKLFDLMMRDPCPSPVICDPNCKYYKSHHCHAERYADHLIANGVTIPVRCQDCKHWKNEINGCTEDKRFCDIGFYMVHKNGFCSFGERKTNEFER